MRSVRSLLGALVIYVVLLFILFTPSGCKKSGESDGAKTVIHFVTWKPNIPEAWEEIFTLFKKEHPGIKVLRETGPHSSTAFHDLLTQKLRNRSEDVDVFLMDVIWPPEFASAGWALPLDDLFPEIERKKFLDGTILANTYNGRIYGVPLFVDSGILYYRKDLLEKYSLPVPGTWEELITTAVRIVSEEKKQGNKIHGFSGQFKQYEGLVCDMMEYILGNGGTIIDSETGKPGLSSDASVEAVRFVRDKIIGAAAPVGVLSYQEPESLDLFIQGKSVFMRNWPYAWEVANSPVRSRIAGKVGIARLPHFKGGRSFSTLGGWQVGISTFTGNRKAAWEFARFLTSEKVQKLLALKAGRAPTRKALYDDPSVLKAYPHFSSMKDVFLTAYPRPRTPLYPAVSNVLQRYFSRVISDKKLDIQKEAAMTDSEIAKILAIETDGRR
jgi:multiple sugar transport system substrate-binding protein